MKADYLLTGDGGPFVGVDLGYQRERYTLEATGAKEERTLLGIGGRAGYRYFLAETGAYVAPWVSVSYRPSAGDVGSGGETFEQAPVQVFPTVHVGYRF
ncbi:MAG: hypothetical protein AAF845_03760 [Bacteroidota bacterium]